MRRIFVLFCVFFVSGACHSVHADEDFDLSYYESLIPLHEVKLPPGPNDWMMHHREPGQSFYEYVESQPVRPDDVRSKIYIMKLGAFGDEYTEIIDKTAEFIRVFFQLDVAFIESMNLNEIPKFARRIHPATGDRQILSTYVLEEVLIPRLPEDAVTLIAFTTSDLWPGEGWNFVFGQASIDDRVGVWSVYRNGNPQKSEEDFKLCLLRTLKTGTHELGHMFGMHHCPYFESAMNGSNHRMESDRRPLYLCPVDLAKLMWNLDVDPQKRYHALAEITEEYGFQAESEFYRRSLEVQPK